MTVRIEIESPEDLDSLIEYLNRAGLKYSIQDEEDIYTDEFKKMLDDRYKDIKNGINMVSQEESEKQIQNLLNSRRIR